MSFKLGELCPSLQELLNKIKAENTFNNIVQHYKYYFALLYSDSNYYPFYKTNVHKNKEMLKQYNILEANDAELSNRKIGFLIATNNIPVIISDLSKFNFSRLLTFEYTTKLFLFKNGLLYAENYTSILRKIIALTNIKFKSYVSIQPENAEIYDTILVINRYQLL